MSDTAAPAPLRPVRRPSGGRRLLFAAGIVLAVLLLLLTLLYLNRRAAAREVLVGWLERQGVQADMDVERIELDGLVASIRIGDPRNPEVTVERVEVDYAIGAPWSPRGLGVTPSRIRLVRPVARVGFRDGKFSFGSLDPLIEEFTTRPPRPDARGPLVLVERARVRVDTDYGPVSILGDARINDGKLMRLSARVPETALKSGDIEARGLAGALEITTTGDRMAVRGEAGADRAVLPGLSGEGVRLTLAGDLPYPDLKTRRGDGTARLTARLAAGRLASGETALRGADLRLAFDGRTTGWLEAFTLQGAADADLTAASLEGPASASALDLRLDGARLSVGRTAAEPRIAWRIDGPAALSAGRLSGGGVDGRGVTLTTTALTLGGRGSAWEAHGPLAVTARRIGWDELSLSDARGAAEIDLVSDGAPRFAAKASLRSSGGAWPLFGPVGRDDPADLVEMKRALADFALDVPGVSVAVDGSGASVRLTRAATVRPSNGGVLTLRPADQPIYAARRGQAGGGALGLTATRGRGLPEAEFAIPAWRLTPSGFTADLDGRAALDFDLARGITVRTRGRLTSENGRLTYAASECAPVTVERLELGENDVAAVSGDVCPADRPLVSVAEGAWRAEGTLSGVNADAPFLALSFVQAGGTLLATGGPRGIGLAVGVDRAGVIDATQPARFHPLSASGSARLANEIWSGHFDLSRDSVPLGRLTLSHDGRAGAGGLVIDAPSIVFAEGGLQPADLSPLAAGFVGSPATGSVSFAGRIDWREGAEGSSGGRLRVDGLDFVSPAGPVRGLTGTVDFTSLAPLVTAPGQRLHADSLQSVAPLTDIDLTFGLDKAGVTIEGGELAVAGGRIRVEPFAVPLDRTQSFNGVIVLENVQLGEVIAGSGFGDKVQLDAVVSGRLPFTVDPQGGVRIAGGSLQAVQPGRLSIQREALTGLEAGGGGEAVPPNTVQDLAYQAMENLSFDILSAEVNSLDQGRLGVLFHIRGRHDPPQRQELRIGIQEFISREFLNRPLPLPSGTGIDLTLDTTLNLNQLVSDLLALNRARAGEAP